jgi:glycine/D-amino acid oxidase-like deaminating enzyme
LVPDSLKLFRAFLPALRLNWKGIRWRLGAPFLNDLRSGSRWALDECSPFERCRMLNPAPLAADIAAAERNLRALFPRFQSVPTLATWAGVIDITPDILPVVSPVEMIPGFFLATGFSGHGFGVGPAAGRLMADQVTGDRPLVDPHPFRLSRFTEMPTSLPSPDLSS